MEERWGGVREDPFSGSVCSQEHVSTPECRQLDSAFRSSLGFRIQVTTIESSLVKSERQAVSVAAGGPHCGKEVRDLAWRISFSCDLVSVENANLGTISETRLTPNRTRFPESGLQVSVVELSESFGRVSRVAGASV